MVTLIGGLVGGLVATIVMTVGMMLLGDDSPPPPAVFWAKYVGDGDPAEAMMPGGMVLHLVYGTVAGGVFAVLVPLVGAVSVATVGSAVTWGLVYGLVLFVGAAVFWVNAVLGMSPETKQAGMFLLFHLVYGAVLGAWVGYGVLG